VLDACDSFRVKVEAIAWCRRRKLPIVVCGSAGGRTDPTLVSARDLSRTELDVMLGQVRRKLELDPQIRELAICTVAKITGARYEWVQHAPEYLKAGGAQEKLDLLANVEAAAGDARLTDRDRAAVQLAAEMTRLVKVSDPTLERARALFGERQLVELVGTIATYNMVARFLEALGIDERGE